MIDTFVALLLAHALADFPLQSDALAQAKQDRSPRALALHALIVMATATLVIAPTQAEALIPLAALTLAHILIDIAKTYAPNTLASFLVDQAAHIGTLVAIAVLHPTLFGQGLYADTPLLTSIMAAIAGLIIATQAGGYAVGLLVRPFGRAFRAEGLPRGGVMIGLLERGLIFLFVLAGQPSAVGFLIAAKSVLRFDASKRKQKAAEYVIIGTLASFGWALICAYATLALLDHLPPLGIKALKD
jgi:hypothetical protein